MGLTCSTALDCTVADGASFELVGMLVLTKMAAHSIAASVHLLYPHNRRYWTFVWLSRISTCSNLASLRVD